MTMYNTYALNLLFLLHYIYSLRNIPTFKCILRRKCLLIVHIFLLSVLDVSQSREPFYFQNMVHSLHFVVIDDEICYYYFRIFLIICNRQTGSKNALRTQLNAFNAVCVSGVTFYSWGVATVFISSASWLKYKWQKHWIWIY